MKNPMPRIMQGLKQPLKRKPNRFVTRLEQQAQLLVLGADALRDYMKKPNKKNTTRVSDLEKQGDEIRRILIDELNRTFVTPIDREDLFSLSRSIDDVLDLAESAMREMDALDVLPNDSLRRMAELLYISTQEIVLAIQRLEKHPNVASQHVMRIKKLENDMESHYTRSLAVLFNTEPKNMGDLMTRLKLREIYQQMYYAMRGAERVSDGISHVVVKLY
jgi:uncharacterized protein